MKQLLSLLITLMLTISAEAQTLNVKTGSVTYLFPSSQTGDMTYNDGTTLTIMGKTFTLNDIDAMTVDNSEVTDNTVNVIYDGTSASVVISGNVAQYLTPTVDGAHVSIAQTFLSAIIILFFQSEIVIVHASVSCDTQEKLLIEFLSCIQRIGCP